VGRQSPFAHHVLFLRQTREEALVRHSEDTTGPLDAAVARFVPDLGRYLKKPF